MEKVLAVLKKITGWHSGPTETYCEVTQILNTVFHLNHVKGPITDIFNVHVVFLRNDR